MLWHSFDLIKSIASFRSLDGFYQEREGVLIQVQCGSQVLRLNIIVTIIFMEIWRLQMKSRGLSGMCL